MFAVFLFLFFAALVFAIIGFSAAHCGVRQAFDEADSSQTTPAGSRLKRSA